MSFAIRAPLKHKGNPPLIWTQDAQFEPQADASANPCDRTLCGVSSENGVVLDGGARLYSVCSSRPSPTPARGAPRTIAADGLHPAEVERVRHVVLDRWAPEAWSGRYIIGFATLGDAALDLPASEVRAAGRALMKRIAQYQGRQNPPLPREALQVFEVEPGLHCHFAFPATSKMLCQLRGLAEFERFMRKPSEAMKAWRYDFERLVAYLTKETDAAPYAWPEGSGGGDRVVLSEPLRSAIVAAGFPPWTRTTSADLRAKPPRRKPEPAPSMSSSPLPEEIEAVAAPLPAVAPAAPPEALAPIEPKVAMVVPPPEPVQLVLFDALPEREHLGEGLRDARRSLGLTQAAAGRLVGIRQAHMSNAEAGRHPIARSRVRALQYLAERSAA